MSDGVSLAKNIDQITRDLIMTIPNTKPGRVGEKLLDLLLLLILASLNLGRKAFAWFNKVNKQQFCNAILMWAAIEQEHILRQVCLCGPLTPPQTNAFCGVQVIANPSNLVLVYHLIDYIRTFDAWRLNGLCKNLDDLLRTSAQSQKVQQYLTSAVPHMYGGSWMTLTLARNYLGGRVTFGDLRHSMALDSAKINKMVKIYSAKALLDVYHS